jgi:hypothetical protein
MMNSSVKFLVPSVKAPPEEEPPPLLLPLVVLVLAGAAADEDADELELLLPHAASRMTLSAASRVARTARVANLPPPRRSGGADMGSDLLSFG